MYAATEYYAVVFKLFVFLFIYIYTEKCVRNKVKILQNIYSIRYYEHGYATENVYVSLAYNLENKSTNIRL